MHSVQEILLSRDLPSRPVIMVKVRFEHLRSTRGGKKGQRQISSKNFEDPDGEHAGLCSKTSNPICKT